MGDDEDFLRLEKRKGWAKRVWLIVPYHPRVLERLWGKGERDELPDAFASKTFQVTFHVPLLSYPTGGSFWRNVSKGHCPITVTKNAIL